MNEGQTHDKKELNSVSEAEKLKQDIYHNIRFNLGLDQIGRASCRERV